MSTATAPPIAAPVQNTTYDEVPYESYPFQQTHPDLLATVATLLRLEPTPVDHCKVLELGCASGGNIVPMAAAMPDSEFIGIDLSKRQIEDGQRFVDKLGIKNVQLKHMSITDVKPDFGQFDYIICHGIFSWVPRFVQDKILEVCANNMKPNGVAYISYNCYPGWHMRGMIRDMMCYHAKQFGTPQALVAQARALLDFLTKSVPQDNNNHYGLLLKSELELLRNKADSYLFHEHLEEYNDPMYFYQFVERAGASGLQYLAESDVSIMVPNNFPAAIKDVLLKISSDIVHIEQYMDFLRNRMFRQTLLGHKELKPNYSTSWEQLPQFRVASPARPVSPNPNILSDDIEKFQGPDGTILSTKDPIVKSAMHYLAEIYPRSVPFDTLRTTARSRLNSFQIQDSSKVANDAQMLGQCLLNFYFTVSTRLLELRVYEPHFVTDVSEKPTASPVARLQAIDSNRVTNQLHRFGQLDDFDRQVVRHLDGTRDKAALVDTLASLVTTNVLNVKQNGQPITETHVIRSCLANALDQQLPKLARMALFIA